MKPIEQRTFAQALREWMESDESGRNAERVAAFVIAKAMSGHFGFFKLVIDMVDGRLHQTAEEEMTFETDCVLVAAEDRRDAELAEAA